MNAEQKQALIEHAKSWIADSEAMRDEIPFGFDGDTEKELSLIKIALAALTAQPIGRVYRGEVSDNNEYPDARVVCLDEQADWENFQDGTELFLRPAPAVDLAELVPAMPSLNNGIVGYNEGWNSCRAAILHSIELANGSAN